MVLIIHKLTAALIVLTPLIFVSPHCSLTNFMLNPVCTDRIINRNLINYPNIPQNNCGVWFWHEISKLPTITVDEDFMFYTIVKSGISEPNGQIKRAQNSQEMTIDEPIQMPPAGETHVMFVVKANVSGYTMQPRHIFINDPDNNWVQMVCSRRDVEVKLFYYRSHHSVNQSVSITCNTTRFDACSQSHVNYLLVENVIVTCRRNITQLNLDPAINPFSLQRVPFTNYSAVLFEVNLAEECKLVWWADGAGEEIIHPYNGLMNQNSKQHRMTFFLLELDSEEIQHSVNRHLGKFHNCQRFFTQQMRCAPIKYQVSFFIHLNFRQNFLPPVFASAESYVLEKENDNWQNFTRLGLSTHTTFTLFQIIRRQTQMYNSEPRILSPTTTPQVIFKKTFTNIDVENLPSSSPGVEPWFYGLLTKVVCTLTFY